MVLADAYLKNHLIMDPALKKEARNWWTQGQWDKIKDSILIDPFKAQNLEACSYDLSVGSEYVSLRDPYSVRSLGENGYIMVSPDETVLILTEEYICLPRNVMAIIVPRARRIFEGTSICATRVDPTWYGKLLIGFTNLNKFSTRLSRGEAFCTCYFMETQEVTKTCQDLKIPHLGREKIGLMKFPNIIYQRKILPPNAVTRQHLDELVEQYGPPFDIVRGAIELIVKEIQDYIDKDVAPNITDKAADNAVKHAYVSQIKIMWTLVIGILGAIGTIVGLIIKMFLH